MRTKWTDEILESRLREISSRIGHFPSCSELRTMGNNNIACKIAKNRGFMFWSDRIGSKRVHSDSDTGWEGEKLATDLLISAGFKVIKPDGVKCPFDLAVNDDVRVDVKSARYATYGACKGWFYRLGKIPQADVIMLLQLDTSDFYILPWWLCPMSNITISTSGGKYIAFKNNLSLLTSISASRQAERMAVISAKLIGN